VGAVGAAAGSVGEALHAGIARGDQHVEEAVDVGAVGGDRVFEAARHAAERGLVQHVVDTLAVGQAANVALDEAEARPLRRRDEALHFVQVALVAGGEVVQPHHLMVPLEQRFEQLAADEAGDQRFFGCFCALTTTGCVGGVHGGLAMQIVLRDGNEACRAILQDLADAHAAHACRQLKGGGHAQCNQVLRRDGPRWPTNWIPNK